MKTLKQHKIFEGSVSFHEHDSRETGTPMKFSTFIPTGKVRGCLMWLSGLECSEETFQAKAGAQRYLADAGMMVICPDTSPRGLQLPHEHDSWDFGSAASFYVDATTPGYSKHYRMFSYLTGEFYELIQREFKVGEHISISGHSMGGHGALVLGLRHPEKFKSVSAFAPIVNPSRCPWGTKAFTGYLGENQKMWAEYDTCELIKMGAKHPHGLLIDQGTNDRFLKEQLLTENLVEAAKGFAQKLSVRYRQDYDHSYYFISTFIGEHIRFHAEHI